MYRSKWIIIMISHKISMFQIACHIDKHLLLANKMGHTYFKNQLLLWRASIKKSLNKLSKGVVRTRLTHEIQWIIRAGGHPYRAYCDSTTHSHRIVRCEAQAMNTHIHSLQKLENYTSMHVPPCHVYTNANIR